MKKTTLLLIAFLFASFPAQLLPFDPAQRVTENTPLYFEVSSTETLFQRLEEFYFALAGEEQASRDWLMMQEKVKQSIGINPVIMEDWEAIGLDTKSPIGISFQTSPAGEKNPNGKQAQDAVFKYAAFLPASDSLKLYQYFLEINRNEPEQNAEEGSSPDAPPGQEEKEKKDDGADPGVRELEADRLFQANGPENTFFLRMDDHIVISNGLELIRSFETTPAKPLAATEIYRIEKKHYENEKTDKSEKVAFLFFSTEHTDEVIQFLSVGGEQFSGLQIKDYISASAGIYLGARGIRFAAYQNLRKEALENQDSLTHHLLDYAPAKPLVDYDDAVSLLYGKFQMNYQYLFEIIKQASEESGTELNSYPFDMAPHLFLDLLSGDLEIKSKLDPLALIDNNISFNITAIPTIAYIDNPARYNMDISINITESEEQNFLTYLSKLEKAASEDENTEVIHDRKNDRDVWQINRKEVVRQPNGEFTEEVVSTYLTKDGRTLYLSTDLDLFNKDKKLSKKSYTQRLINQESKRLPDTQIQSFMYADLASIYQYFMATPTAAMLYSYKAYLERLQTLQVVQYLEGARVTSEFEIILKE